MCSSDLNEGPPVELIQRFLNAPLDRQRAYLRSFKDPNKLDQFKTAVATHQTFGRGGEVGLQAAPQATDMFDTARQWLHSLGEDVRYGGGSTLPGRVLQSMGAQPTASGLKTSPDQPDIGEFVMSTPLGAIRALEGLAGAQSGIRQQDLAKTSKGAMDVLGGLAQATQIPTALMGMGPGGMLEQAAEIPLKMLARKAAGAAVGGATGYGLGSLSGADENTRDLLTLAGMGGGAWLGEKALTPDVRTSLMKGFKVPEAVQNKFDIFHPDNEALLSNTAAHAVDKYGKVPKNANEAYKAFENLDNVVKQDIDKLQGALDSQDIRAGRPATFSGRDVVKDALNRMPRAITNVDQAEQQQFKNALVDEYANQNFTRQDLRDKYAKLNAEVQDFFDKNTGKQIGGLIQGKTAAQKMAERNAVKSLLDAAMDPEGNNGFSQLNDLRHGAIDMRNAVSRVINSADLEKADTGLGKLFNSVKSLIPGGKNLIGVEWGKPLEAWQGSTTRLIRKGLGNVGKPTPIDVGNLSAPLFPGQGRLAAGGPPTPPIAGRPQPQLGGPTLTPNQLENLNAFLRSGGTSEYYTPTQLENLRRSVEIGETPREPSMADVLRAWQEWQLNPNIRTSVPGSQVEQMKAAQNPNVSLLDVLRNRWWGSR